MRRKPNQGLFPGYWTDLAGKKLRRVRRDEYPEMYRLHRLATEVEATLEPSATRYYSVPGGTARISWPGIPTMHPRWEP